ncbi:DUF397 domain-containing protein [Crossiella sp. SN42]|uniref:DUF397 domain-containing protein n=1 Tax=Crossiella sp. SN42 TaxID=2944808 RepID=UPI00207C98A3|nr:DUF397 domain-containing protein [Crossiella sp. SN42]MCO1580877.1 DUF397 domain-containing protein [Crossiella sp. SN42]
MTEQHPSTKVPVYDDKAEIRDTLDFSGARWLSSEDDPDGTGKVEIAFVDSGGATYIGMRNSAQPEGPILVFTTSEWEAFLAGAKDGEFTEPW